MAVSLKTGNAAARPVINVTPLVDVVLVLLIIFMVVTPLLEKELPVNLPSVASAEAPPTQMDPIVLWVKEGGEIRLNDNPVELAQLQGRIGELLARRDDRTVFFRADPDALYRDCVTAMDTAKAAGAETIGTVLAP